MMDAYLPGKEGRMAKSLTKREEILEILQEKMAYLNERYAVSDGYAPHYHYEGECHGY